ncbi:hypothetical protein NWI01_35050 [Nitrobacter winogradskyi]|uniref:Uncharacterized protein n=1 Tax=Nitrobacter winogradskyi TaxID=913 RepID=A0A4Y3WFE1_NITWI|nr:hypothetical protein NWI01_35050 [Nitrobacter winogradskyi]
MPLAKVSRDRAGRGGRSRSLSYKPVHAGAFLSRAPKGDLCSRTTRAGAMCRGLGTAGWLAGVPMLTLKEFVYGP